MNEHYNATGGEGYASPPSAPRDYSDQGSVKGYGSGIKGYGSNVHNNNSHYSTTTTHSTQDHSLKDDDLHRNHHDGCDHQRNGSGHSSVKEFGNDRGMSGIRNNIGDTTRGGSSDCDYGGHHDHMRHARLEEWLSTAHKRRMKENFGAYIWRASALANSELRHRKKQCWGDEYGDPMDRFVMRLFYGMKLKLERTESVVLGVEDETGILDILREECEELSKSGQLPIDQRSIQYTPLIISEMQERSSNNSNNGGY